MILIIREYLTCRLIHLALKIAPEKMEIILGKAFVQCLEIYIKKELES